jgi:hypothetical protein
MMQAHIVLPHHHHKNRQEPSGHSQSHTHKHGSGHKHDHEKKHSKAGKLADLIGHESHASSSAEILHASVAEHAVKKADVKIPFIAEPAFLFKFPKVPESLQYTSPGFGFYKSCHYYSFQLRGPPAFVL